MAAVEKLSYRPNLLAKGLRQGKRHSVGIVVPHLHLSVFSMIAQSIEATLREAGYSAFLCSVEDNPIAERDSLNRLRNGLVDGIIIAGTGKNKILSVISIVHDQPLHKLSVSRTIHLIASLLIIINVDMRQSISSIRKVVVILGLLRGRSSFLHINFASKDIEML